MAALGRFGLIRRSVFSFTLNNYERTFNETFDGEFNLKINDYQYKWTIQPHLANITSGIVFRALANGFAWRSQTSPLVDQKWFRQSSCISSLLQKERNFSLFKRNLTIIDVSDFLPKLTPFDEEIIEIDNEIKTLPSELHLQAEIIHTYFHTYLDALLDQETQEIFRYLEGTISIEKVHLTRENAAEQLRLIKLVDQVYKRFQKTERVKFSYKNTTYELRTKILELLSPEIHSTAVYTYSIDLNKLKNVDYLIHKKNWLPERLDFYEKIVVSQYREKVVSLAERLHDDESTVHIIKGGTASGKTTFAKKRFSYALDENGELSGSINPDHIKEFLQKATSSNLLANNQVHDEAVRGPLSTVFEQLCSEIHGSIIVDRPLSLNEEFEKIVAMAKKRLKRIKVYEIHAPLDLCMRRVFETRHLTGKEPCVDPLKMKKAYLDTLRSRGGILHQIVHEDLIHEYELYCTNGFGDPLLAAEKKHGTFRVISADFYENATRVPLEYEIESIITQSDELTWHIPLKKALEYHVLGHPKEEAIRLYKKELEIKEKYGPIQIQPFTGGWLEDFPNIQQHILSEHVLQNNGVDEKGIGVHWQTKKFSTPWNPQLNPEAKIQMKLGYYIVPIKHIEEMKSKVLSHSILKDLEVRSEFGELIGYRFFVHPEAYQHFAPLHDAGFLFVKSDESEFMGTPTSSYRSWVIRCIDKQSEKNEHIPFIVKLGVTSPNDTSRLHPSSEVEKSLKNQKIYFDDHTQMEHLWIFQETLGLTLKKIPNYPQPMNICDVTPTDSGMIIREFPKDILDGKCKIYSFQSLMSVERRKHPGVCFSDSTSSLPLIFDLIDASIKKGLVSSTFDFVKRYLVTKLFVALNPLIFNGCKLTLPLHSQNLCLVVDNDNIPIGFAIRDLADIRQSEHYVEMVSYSLKYANLIKLLNVLTTSKNDYLPPIPGAPTQIGFTQPLEERSVFKYLYQTVTDEKKILENLTITFEEYEELLRIFDEQYFSYLKESFPGYFRIPQLKVFVEGKTLPSAEKGSSQAKIFYSINKMLFDYLTRFGNE